MVDTQTIDLKVCGITSSNSIITAANNNIKSLGFASNNLLGPNTCDDDLIKNLIEECDEYKIESVLLSRYQSALELVKQIDYTKPKIISCSYFFEKSDFKYLKNIFKKLKIGIAANPENFDNNYFQSISSIIDIFYYDLNIYEETKIKTFSIYDCLDQIRFLKKLKKPIYIGGGINHKNAKLVIDNVHPNGLDVSRSLKDKYNNISEFKLKKLIHSLSAF
ncbi:MAG: N-(5'-phosphoribosyl)anthranilate isomerase [Alphaproteobacteria bacterium MarineAlpha5_Bin8]|nr:MAG: N-(5'-phosphoribosyl)anthranilate isomerase [Alphaproteobacteria bacterium MarineAlpha5_Bin7]PPR45825.1 MAG: N-(5'-phosphoribosyl)anthranilate isomerase [Alphaproteobacteria bacterium MarineAlpha5_Bin8]PPR54600.1 MAG: N-(5'-phosphoribosyl)anthranilate isomerase [Alphaproteobacteria bacterium MarineAlpha5_Bin6]|tara:strand:+ start:3497 stop:4156 length:660 start_codon:yes stop_codon:yes gene_type:complete